ncbi:O-antigen ligase family protein [Pedobacter rhodius]|uniref:O-antigen ligase family protein n=1 Tax=Pedobacter rhodius TaxID=3004098 RepID=A0ABT4KXQ0_9SPHI|nr:O-antigen ligase family protein [Pedobacter sp. SJ11]MCZ4223007.1 O-antigen ligase family protein [Pedobacter sp. SJ11]
MSLNFPVGILIEVFFLLAFIVAVFTIPKENWRNLNNDLFYLFLFWFVLSILEVANPAGANILGWLKEIRSAAEYPLLIVMLYFLIFTTYKDLNNFLLIIVIISTVAALDGIKQLHLGLSRGDQAFLNSGGSITHILFGRLRVFSFYTEAAQFGASQAQMCLVALILALGPIKKKLKILLFICSALMFYGMLISGTRGALFALVPGAFLAIILSKKFKVLILGGAVAVLFLCVLKFTYIGNGNYQIYRLRSALNPEDPSLKVRMVSQQKLKDYMSGLPFGGGLGVIGANGMEYNQDKFLSKIQPDSYWVKIWAMYGIVGFTIWISMNMYILGKCCGIVWRIRDEGLKIKGIALTSGFAGILFCSYGNEVINTMPSAIIVCASLAFVYIMPKLDKELSDNKILTE